MIKLKFLFFAIVITLTLTCISCAGMLHSVNLPVAIQVMDSTTKQPIKGAKVELQWLYGFQGYYQGKPVDAITDSSGKAIFTPESVPPISSDGYSLDKRIEKLFVSTVLVFADGYKTTKVEFPENKNTIQIYLLKGNKDEVYIIPQGRR